MRLDWNKVATTARTIDGAFSKLEGGKLDHITVNGVTLYYGDAREALSMLDQLEIWGEFDPAPDLMLQLRTLPIQPGALKTRGAFHLASK